MFSFSVLLFSIPDNPYKISKIEILFGFENIITNINIINKVYII